MNPWQVVAYAFAVGFVILMIVGIVAIRRERRLPPPDPSWSGDRHSKARAYSRGDIIKK